MAAATGGSLALSVHGPLGVLDLLVPAGAAATDVAREYAEQSGLAAVPVLYTRLGQHLQPDVALADVGIGTGAVLVATTEVQRLGGSVLPRETHPGEDRPGPLSVLWFAGAVMTAVLAAWFARSGSDTRREATVVLLVVAAVLGVLPLGRYAAHRLLAVPAFAGSAAFVLAWDPQPARIPTVLGVAALVAAVAAAVARTVDRRNEEALQVWVTVGVAVFAVTGLAALLGFPPRVPWALLLVAAMLAARFVPGFAVDVPDQYLIDLERLAVNAWSARERATGRRGRSVVPPSAVATVAARGTRIVTAYAVAILAVTSVSAPLLLGTATLSLDRMGARCLVLLCGCSLVLAGRSYRHAAARALLRAAGLVCWSAVLVAALTSLRSGAGTPLAGIAITTAVAVLVAAVATGRGWRSAWWSRRAEIAEALCGSAAVASVLVATGVFRAVWESIHIQV
ncbi:hypothetical protein [Nocardioides sp. LS1]|uniref:hypothetical protein n=1 Tax=Nocardioides sp. LS1 TaxID=1027620 RepID=UPI000F61B24E|nr:hypothetical protein [Nocardioides sp. LS1]GCD89862.1 hypothetical protein NLS1_18680 [Nocardioides sp. LS1]